MTAPENWPWFVKVILSLPMAAGGACGWLPLAKNPKWRKTQVALIAYFYLFGIIFVWKQPLVVVLILGVVALSLLAFLIIRWRVSKASLVRLPFLRDTAKRS
jgi:hypothetical protein